MKKVSVLIFLSILLFSCGKEDANSNSRNCREVDYQSEFEIQLTDEVCFPDGNSFVLEAIEFAFCPCDVFCGNVGRLVVKLNTKTVDSKTNAVSEGITDPIIDKLIFDNHSISSASYYYEDGEFPLCIEDFDPEKVVIILAISPQ